MTGVFSHVLIVFVYFVMVGIWDIFCYDYVVGWLVFERFAYLTFRLTLFSLFVIQTKVKFRFTFFLQQTIKQGWEDSLRSSMKIVHAQSLAFPTR